MNDFIQDIKEGLKFPFDESLIEHWPSIEKYKKILKINLDFMFYQLCNNEVDINQSFQVIRGIELPFRNKNINFSIEVLARDFNGYYTSYCPELEGCITEGPSKMESLDNLCYAISETLILNYDILKIDALNKKAICPKMTPGYFFEKEYVPYTYANIPRIDGGFKKIYISKKHLLMKNENREKVTLTLKNEGFHVFTKHLIGKVAGTEV